MIDLLNSNIAEIRALCDHHRVRALHLFGSATTDHFDPAQSDIDFLVEFLPDAPAPASPAPISRSAKASRLSWAARSIS